MTFSAISILWPSAAAENQWFCLWHLHLQNIATHFSIHDALDTMQVTYALCTHASPNEDAPSTVRNSLLVPYSSLYTVHVVSAIFFECNQAQRDQSNFSFITRKYFPLKSCRLSHDLVWRITGCSFLDWTKGNTRDRAIHARLIVVCKAKTP